MKRNTNKEHKEYRIVKTVRDPAAPFGTVYMPQALYKNSNGIEYWYELSTEHTYSLDDAIQALKVEKAKRSVSQEYLYPDI